MAEHRTGIALHQWPRSSIYREELIAPKGFLLTEHDFSGQEMRWMCEYSGDLAMKKIFTSAPPYDDAHSYMGGRLTNTSFEDMIAGLHQPKDSEAFKLTKNNRYLGKFANLSLQYRTGAHKLMSKARIEYKIPMNLYDAERTKRVYETTFPGVPEYWRTQIARARAQGYVESLHGKRYRFPVDAWESRNKWSSESTSINWPIQGIGGGQKALAMKYLRPYWEKTGGQFAWDLHDGLFSFFPEDIAHECALEVKEILSNLPYEKEWGYQPEIPFPVDASIGKSWGTLEEL